MNAAQRRALGIRCERCRFWEYLYDNSGDCYRFPPQRTSNGADFPTVSKMGWCGEWQPTNNSEPGVYADYLETEGCPKEFTDKLREFGK